jgi:DNA-binding transcriptional regulator YiaG
MIDTNENQEGTDPSAWGQHVWTGRVPTLEAQRLMRLKKARKLTIKKLGRLFGVSPRTVEGWLYFAKPMSGSAKRLLDLAERKKI